MADHDLATVIGNSDSERPFPFFRLPRELRNVVYADLSRPLTKPNKITGNTIIAHFLCVPAMRTVSRQFKNEYEEEIFRTARLMVRSGAVETVLCKQLKGFLPMIQHVEIRCAIGWWETSLEDHNPRCHKQLATVAAILPALKTLRLHAAVSIGKFMACVEHNQSQPARFFTELEVPVVRPNGQKESVAVKKDLCIRSDLFEFKESYQDDIPEAYIAGVCKSHQCNPIIYRAILSTDTGSWYGVELQTVHAGELCWEAMYAEAKRGWEAELAELPLLIPGE